MNSEKTGGITLGDDASIVNDHHRARPPQPSTIGLGECPIEYGLKFRGIERG